MRPYYLIFFGSVFFTTMATGQSETKFTIEVTRHEVQVGESFEVTFILENGKNGKFIPPNWEQSNFVVLGSSQSSSFAFSNGVSTSTAVFKYQIMARDTGVFEIPVALVKTGAEEMHTVPQTIHVFPGDPNTLSAPLNDRHPATPASEPKKKIKTIRL